MWPGCERWSEPLDSALPGISRHCQRCRFGFTLEAERFPGALHGPLLAAPGGRVERITSVWVTRKSRTRRCEGQRGAGGGSESFPTGCPVHGDTCSFNSAARLRNIGVDSVLRKARRTEVGPGHPVQRDPTPDAPWARANAAGEAGEKCRALLPRSSGDAAGTELSPWPPRAWGRLSPGAARGSRVLSRLSWVSRPPASYQEPSR